MSIEIRRALDDHVRRHALAWCFIAASQSLSAYLYASGIAPRIPLYGVALVWASWSMGQDRVWTATLLTLPLSLRDAGRTLWWSAIGLPAIGFTGLNLVTWLGVAAHASGAITRDGASIALWLLTSAGMIGFALLGSFPAGPAGGTIATHAARAVSFARPIAALGLGFIGLPRNGPFLPFTLALATSGIALAAYLFLRPERLALRRLGRLAAAPSAVFPPAERTRRFRWSGWMVVAGQYGFAVARAFATSLLLFLLLWRFWAAFGDFPLAFVFLIAVPGFIMKPWVGAIRALRLLPLSSERLALALFLMALAPSALWLLSLALLYAAGLSGPSGFPLLWLMMVVPCQSCLHLPAALRFGKSLMAVLPSTAMMAVAVPLLWAPTTLLVLLPGAIVVAAYLWTRYELRSGRRAYRRPETGAFAAATVPASE